MYWPCFVLPYHSSPSLWNTLVEVFTHTLPPPPPGACAIVEGSTTSALAFLVVFLSILEVSSPFAGAVACATHSADVPTSDATRTNFLSFGILTGALLTAQNSPFDTSF